MNRKTFVPILSLALLFATACQRTANDNAASNANVSANANVSQASGGAGAQNAASDIFSTFPDSQAVIFANGSRIVEAMQRVMPAEQFNQMFQEAQRETGFDIRSIRHAAMGIRLNEPITPSTQPDILVVLKGNFPADQLISQMRSKAAGGTRQETYNGRTIEIMTQRAPYQPTQGGAYPPPSTDPLNEMAVLSLNPETLILGTPSYVRLAIDANAGTTGRLRQDLLDVVTRNSDSLLTMVGNAPPSLTAFMRQQGMMQNPEFDRIFSALRQTQIIVNMTGSDFVLQVNAKMDNQDSANYLNGLVARTKMEFETRFQSMPPPPNPQEAQNIQSLRTFLNSIQSTVNGDEVRISVNVPISSVQSLVQSQMR